MSKFISDPEKYFNSLPKKPIGAGVLLFNKKREIFIVKPSYKNYWSILGGVTENNESPREAVEREIYEEIGLKLKVKRLICVDYAVANGKFGKTADSIQFLFFGGQLSDRQMKKMKIDTSEIETYQFLKIKKVLPLLNDSFRERLKNCLEAIESGKTIYLEKGKR